jgi:thioredoxin-like negative regulator of GroEL
MDIASFLDKLPEKEQEHFKKLAAKAAGEDANRREISQDIQILLKNCAKYIDGTVNEKTLLREFWNKYGSQIIKEKKQNLLLSEDRFNDLPGPLFDLLNKYDKESVYLRKVWRLIDSFEWAIKWHTVICLADMFRSADYPDEIKVLLSSGLRTPSLGTWNLFFRESIKAIKHPTAPWQRWERLVNLENRYNLVNFRNVYAHGATPDEEQCKSDCEFYYPLLLQLLGSEFFTEIDLAVSRQDGVFLLEGNDVKALDIELYLGHAAAIVNGQVLDLWPLGLYEEDDKGGKGWNFFYFNALKANKIEQLNYEHSLILRDAELWEPFHAHFPLKEWRKISSPEADFFRSRVDTLTESFKGRREERNNLLEFCMNGKGTLVVTGVPGIGKSTLLAQVFKEVKAGINSDGEMLKDAYPAIVEYFIRRDTETDSEMTFLSYLNKRLDALFKLKGFLYGNTKEEMAENLAARLNRIEDSGWSRLVLFIDGLDEGPDIARYIPESRPWLTFVCAGRPGEILDDFYQSRNIEQRDRMEVGPLSIKDIRALLYDVVDKYDRNLTKEYIEAVEKRSQGNPLYLKLLCDQIFSGEQQLGDIGTLPEKIDELFKKAVQRITQNGSNENAMRLLLLLTEAKSSLPVVTIAEFLKLNSFQAQSAVDTCRELLFEDPLTPDVEDYQIYHERLREWLRESADSECKEMATRIIDHCYSWRNIQRESTLRYSLAYAAEHLFDVADPERLWTLLKDEGYRKSQIQESKRYHNSIRSLQRGLELYIKRQGKDINDDPRLCWLALRLGELSQEQKKDVQTIFHLAETREVGDKQRIDLILYRLDSLEEIELLGTSIILLVEEIIRLGFIPERQNDAFGQLLIDKIGEETRNLSRADGDDDWDELFDVEFLAFLTFSLKNVIHDIEIDPLVQLAEKGWNIEQYNSSLIKLYKEDPVQSILPLELAFANLHRLKEDYKKFNLVKDIAIALNKKHLDSSSRKRYLLERLLDSFDDIEEKGDSDSINILLLISSAFAKAGDVDKAEKILENALAILSGSSSQEWVILKHAEIASTYIDIGGLEKAKKILLQAMNLAASIARDQQVEYAFGELVKVLLKADDVFAAKAVVDMFEDKFAKSIILIELACFHFNSGKIDKACESLELAYSNVNQIFDPYNKLRLLVGVVKEFLKTGNKRRAEDTLEQSISIADVIDIDDKIESKQISILDVCFIEAELPYSPVVSRKFDAILAIANLYLQIDLYKGEKYLDQAFSIYSDLDKNFDASKPLSEICKSYIKIGSTGRGLEKIKSIMEKIRYCSDPWFSICHSLIEAGDHSNALSVINEIENIENQERLLLDIASFHYNSGNQAAFEKILEKVLKRRSGTEAEHYEKYSWHRDYETIAILWNNAGKTETALSTVKLNKNKKNLSNGLIALTVNSLKNSNIESAKLFFCEAILVRDEEITQKKYFEGLERLSAVFAQSGFVESALCVAERLVHHGFNILHHYTIIAQHLAESGDYNQSFATIDLIDHEYYKSEALQSVCECLVRKNDYKRAIHTIEHIGNESDRNKALMTVVKHLVRAGEDNAALELVSKITDFWDRVECFVNIAEVLIQTGYLEDAIELMEQQHDLIAKLEFSVEHDNHLHPFYSYRKKGVLEKIVFQVVELCRLYSEDFPIEECEKGKDFGEVRDINVLSEVVHYVYQRSGTIHQAMRVLDLDIYEKDNLYKDKLLSQIVAKLANSDEILQAKELSDCIGSWVEQTEAMLSIAIAFARNGDSANALDMIETIENEHCLPLNAYPQIALALKLEGYVDECLPVFHKAITSIAQFDEYKPFGSKMEGALGIVDALVKSHSDYKLFKELFSNAPITKREAQIIISAWRDRSIQEGNVSLSDLRESVIFQCFAMDVVHNGVLSLIIAYLKVGDISMVERIITICPQLELSFLFKQANEICKSYHNITEWIDDIEDEGVQGKVALWAMKVESGKMTQRQFEEKVSSLL